MKTISMAFWLSPLLVVTALSASLTDSDIVWDVGASGLFDATNRAYSMTDGVVVVDLESGATSCPTGLGHLASGRESVKEIQFVFENRESGE